MQSIIFLILLIAAVFFFSRSIRKIRRNILLGKEIDLDDRPLKRWKTLSLVALGQSKMVVRPVAGFFHIIIYLSFFIINIEIIEIILDGILGTHRIFGAFIPSLLYSSLIGSFEILAFGVILACLIFLIRRNILKLKRFWNKEMTVWPRSDANIILLTEIALMTAFLLMNGTDKILQNRGVEHYTQAGSFPISNYLGVFFNSFTNENLIFLERFSWWFHITMVFIFINYIPFSKHFHIFLSFPNVYYSNLNPKGKFNNMRAVTDEVKLILDPSSAAQNNVTNSKTFGAKDVTDLNWKNLMDAYSCTECGRCTDECPANKTGKLLSPRKIVMDTRDRLEEVGRNIDKHGKVYDDNKSLFSYISPEELWACTTCNACVEACPVNIDPLAIITEMRRFLVMEQSTAPKELNTMFTNIENNGAPWQFSPTERFSWAENIK